ncbi:MAG: TolC family protein [Candidatus Pedobacter colombiensis]|uniref:TolC family protein n=1 Tax=Candidatus Pedobacter colombiensis TaxID=3121371 RepID=A0AAJ5W3R4_9SPHI|nr:TolC family protein [Pedobacter sp.]WEK17601.1 MAG: TolC family protein [Pedobacter sp.]
MEHFRKRRFVIILCLSFFTLRSHAQRSVKESADLNFFINQALASSPLSKDYKNQLLMNKIDSLRLRAGYLPQIAASSTGLYAPIINGYGYDVALSNGQTLDALLSLNYNLISKGSKDNKLQQVLLQRDSIHYASKLSELDLKKAITEQYITAYGSQQQVDFNHDVYDLLVKEEVLLKELTRANTYRQTEYLTFLVTLKQQQLQWKQAELQFKNDYATLNYLSGIHDTTAVRLKEPSIAIYGDGLQEKNFFIKRFQIDSLKTLNEKQAVDFNYKPKTSLYVNGGYNSSFILQPYKNFGTSVGFTVSVPLYDGHQKKMQHDKLNLQLQTGSMYRNYFSTQQKQQIDLLKQQITTTDGLYEQIKDQIKITSGLIDVDRKLLHTGDVKIVDFVIAINNYMVAQNLFRQTNINRLRLINQLNYWNR